MSGSSSIEWTDMTWNPVTGCTRVSPGCAHCYIERTPPFRMEGRRFTHGSDGATTGVRLHPERLNQPLSWRKPRRVFVNSLSDLFHEDVPARFIFDVFEVMGRAPQQTFQVLTKRPERALAWFRGIRTDSGGGFDPATDPGTALLRSVSGTPIASWPLPNVWLGVSIENARFTWRADVLRQIPAAVRFISAEPLLGSLFEVGDSQIDRELTYERWGFDAGIHRDLTVNVGRAPLDLTGIDWVIVGGESGPGARPMHPEWAREIRDACLAQCWQCNSFAEPDSTWSPGCEGCFRHTAFFFKQWGEWAPKQDGVYPGDICMSADGDTYEVQRDHVCAHNESEGEWLRKVGKKRAGRVLDGRIWDEFPGTMAVPA